jgi:hypothetical protein
MTGTGPKSIQSYISGDAAAKARQAEVLRKTLAPLWQEVVGNDLAEHSHPVRVQGRSLLVHADGPLWANQIRHRYTDFVQRLQRYPELRQIAELRVKIVPKTPLARPKIADTLGPHLSANAGEVIQDVAQSIKDEALREALLRLSRRSSR